MGILSLVAIVVWFVVSRLLFPLLLLGLAAIGIGAGQHFVQNYGHLYSDRVPKPSSLDSLLTARQSYGSSDLGVGGFRVVRILSRLFATTRKPRTADQRLGGHDPATAAPAVSSRVASAPVAASRQPPSALARVLLARGGGAASRRRSLAAASESSANHGAATPAYLTPVPELSAAIIASGDGDDAERSPTPGGSGRGVAEVLPPVLPDSTPKSLPEAAPTAAEPAEGVAPVIHEPPVAHEGGGASVGLGAAILATAAVAVVSVGAATLLSDYDARDVESARPIPEPSFVGQRGPVVPTLSPSVDAVLGSFADSRVLEAAMGLIRPIEAAIAVVRDPLWDAISPTRILWDEATDAMGQWWTSVADTGRIVLSSAPWEVWALLVAVAVAAGLWRTSTHRTEGSRILRRPPVDAVVAAEPRTLSSPDAAAPPPLPLRIAQSTGQRSAQLPSAVGTAAAPDAQQGDLVADINDTLAAILLAAPQGSPADGRAAARRLLDGPRGSSLSTDTLDTSEPAESPEASPPADTSLLPSRDHALLRSPPVSIAAATAAAAAEVAPRAPHAARSSVASRSTHSSLSTPVLGASGAASADAPSARSEAAMTARQSASRPGPPDALALGPPVTLRPHAGLAARSAAEPRSGPLPLQGLNVVPADQGGIATTRQSVSARTAAPSGGTPAPRSQASSDVTPLASSLGTCGPRADSGVSLGSAAARRAAARDETRRRLLADVAAATGMPADDPALLWAVYAHGDLH